MTRVAAIDCGTNSLRLLVADVDGDRLRDVDRRMEIVRLGQRIDRSGQIAPDALQRTLAVLEKYSRRIDELGAERVRMVATSATRDAANRDEFVDGVRLLLGQPPDVISGREEASLSFAGATRGLPASVPVPYLVVDIGGGSTEFCFGAAWLDAARSVDIGCVRLTERHFGTDPPSPGQVAAALADVAAALDAVGTEVPFGSAGSVIGLAGSVTTVAGIHLGLPAYDPSRIHHSRIPAADVGEVAGWLLRSTRAERAAREVIQPGRVDVIAAGALVLRCVVERTSVDEVVASEADILDGIAWSLASAP